MLFHFKPKLPQTTKHFVKIWYQIDYRFKYYINESAYESCSYLSGVDNISQWFDTMFFQLRTARKLTETQRRLTMIIMSTWQTYGNFAPATDFPCTKITFWGFYFCSHFLSSGRNILKFDMKIIQQFGRIWFKTVEIWNTQVICYFSAQTLLVNQKFELKNSI